jgi:hypothetical protein
VVGGSNPSGRAIKSNVRSRRSVRQRRGLGWSSDVFTAARWDANISYSLLDATFRENLTLASNSPAAGADGNIFVHSGDRLPLTPRSRLTLGIDYAPFDQTCYTFGSFAGLAGLPPNFNLSDPRAYSPGPPRTYFGGIRLSF